MGNYLGPGDDERHLKKIDKFLRQTGTEPDSPVIQTSPRHFINYV
jgi:hypothetical protein